MRVSWLAACFFCCQSQALGFALDSPVVGLVEGFYWAVGDAVQGQFGQYSASQRLQVIAEAGKQGLNFYMHAPNGLDKQAEAQSLNADWRLASQLADSLNISLVYCLRPGFISDDSLAAAQAHAMLSRLLSYGVHLYSLCFDDVNGGDTKPQLLRQVRLVQNLTASLASQTLVSFTPGSYFGSRLSQQSRLAHLDRALPSQVAFVLTGPAVTPNQVALRAFPKLASGRRILFWDNWNAEDTSARLPWGLTRAVPSSLFASAKLGYVMNLAFPPERVIHQIFRTGQLWRAASASQGLAVDMAAAAWSAWLVERGFWSQHQPGLGVGNLTAALASAIAADRSFSSVDAMELANPVLKGVFPQ
jgi:hypothetical protein